MTITWIFVGIGIVAASAALLLGVRRGRDRCISMAQRAFYLSSGAGVLCALVVALVGASGVGEVFAFGLIASLEAAFIALLLWRFPRFTQSVVHTKHWDTPTT
jgi:hypothetical protein